LPERRRAVRYQLKLALDYRAVATDSQARNGHGVTNEISRTAVRFTSDAPLPVGTSVQLFIEWPSVEKDRPLLLKTVGYVLRSQAREVVALISRHMLGPATEVGRGESPAASPIG
jgi:hypothetical protein